MTCREPGRTASLSDFSKSKDHVASYGLVGPILGGVGIGIAAKVAKVGIDFAIVPDASARRHDLALERARPKNAPLVIKAVPLESLL
jgi:hypothetical protein